MPLTRLLPILLFAAASLAQNPGPSPAEQRALRHQTEEWLLLEPHLPSLETASPEALMQEGDILRARRFEEDALEFYTAALRRGGDQAPLLNRIGVVHLILRQPEIARIDFRRALSLRPDDAQAWNNLGATEYFIGNNRAALDSYLHAVRLKADDPLFHSNLGTAYFQLKDYESAGSQFGIAFRLDPHVFDHGNSGGLEARMLTASERGRFCFELARVAAQQHQDEEVLAWLRKSLDAGYDVGSEIRNFAAFAPYRHDPRVKLLITNAHAMRVNRLAGNTPVPSLADIADKE